MPVYEFTCEDCDFLFDVLVDYEDREQPLVCIECGGPAHYGFPAPSIVSSAPSGDRKLIWDEKQVSSEKGEDWRDEGTNRRPGGAGRKLYFTD